MSSDNSKTEANKQDTKPVASAQTSGGDELPLLNQQQSIMSLLRNALNPNGENPKVDEYITSTFGYVQNVFHRMQTTNDKDATAKEIAEDLSSKFDKWLSEQKKERAENSNKPEEPEKVEDLD